MTKRKRAELAPVPHHEHDSAEVLKMERLLLFTDAVFAIIMTLLALEVRLPDGSDLRSAQGLMDALADTTGKIAAYALSFLVIAMIWNTHLRRYRYLKAINGKIIVGNILQLLLTGLIPFATSIIARSAQPLAVSLYAGVITANILVGWITWRLAVADPRLVTSQFTERERREGDWRSLCAAAIFGISIPISFNSPVVAMLLWALQIPANILVQRLVVRDRSS